MLPGASQLTSTVVLLHPPLPLVRCVSSDGEGASAKRQSRERLLPGRLHQLHVRLRAVRGATLRVSPSTLHEISTQILERKFVASSTTTLPFLAFRSRSCGVWLTATPPLQVHDCQHTCCCPINGDGQAVCRPDFAGAHTLKQKCLVILVFQKQNAALRLRNPRLQLLLLAPSLSSLFSDHLFSLAPDLSSPLPSLSLLSVLALPFSPSVALPNPNQDTCPPVGTSRCHMRTSSCRHLLTAVPMPADFGPRTATRATDHPGYYNFAEQVGLSLALRWRFAGVSLAFLWCFSGVSLVFLWRVSDLSLAFHGRFTDLSLAFSLSEQSQNEPALRAAWRYRESFEPGGCTAFRSRFHSNLLTPPGSAQDFRWPL